MLFYVKFMYYKERHYYASNLQLPKCEMRSEWEYENAMFFYVSIVLLLLLLQCWETRATARYANKQN